MSPGFRLIESGGSNGKDCSLVSADSEVGDLGGLLPVKGFHAQGWGSQ